MTTTTPHPGAGRAAIAARTLRTDRWWFPPAIQAAGRDGFCYLRGVMEDSIAGLSVPVRDRANGRAIAALNISTSLQRTSEEQARGKLLPELRAAAASIEAALR